VLFSEPKIPQSKGGVNVKDVMTFQCSSASRKFLNVVLVAYRLNTEYIRFQCSSASRKFLNIRLSKSRLVRNRRFSALQRAENSSIVCSAEGAGDAAVSVLFSEPKIPQCADAWSFARREPVSVLFSEPKIPQSSNHVLCTVAVTVSVLFSEPKIPQCRGRASRQVYGSGFQCSSASRKFLNVDVPRVGRGVLNGFSALQRAENSSIDTPPAPPDPPVRFQCSSASRKFLNR